MDSKGRYKLVSTGKLRDGFEHAAVVDNLQQVFSIDEAKALGLLKGNVTIKTGLEQAKAEKLRQRFHSAGLDVELVGSASNQSASGQHVAKAQGSKSETDALFSDEIPEFPSGDNYRFKVIALGLASLAAPSFYIGLVLINLFLLLSSLFSFPLFHDVFNSILIRSVISLFIMLVLLLLLLVLLKPFLARKKTWHGYRVKNEDFRSLYDIADTVSGIVGTPPVAQIYLDRGNAVSASLENPTAGAGNNTLDIRIGMPLIATMDSRQFVWVLAHEMSHFAQPHTMIVYNFAKAMQGMFYRMVHEDDRIDEYINEQLKEPNLNKFIHASLTQLQTLLARSRKLMGLPLRMSTAVLEKLRKGLVSYADSYASLIAGSAVLPKVVALQRRLASAQEEVEAINRSAWEDRKLLGDIPLAVADMTAMTTPAPQSEEQEQDNRARVGAVIKRNDTGMVQKEFPLSDLCSHLSSLSEKVTLYHYHYSGIKQAERHVAKNREIMLFEKEKAQARESLDEYFNDTYSMRFHSLSEPENRELQELDLPATIAKLRENLFDYGETQEKYLKLLAKRSTMELAREYLELGAPQMLEKLDVTTTNMDKLTKVVNRYDGEIGQLKERLQQVDRLFYQRIIRALALENGHSEAFFLKETLQKLTGLESAVAAVETQRVMLLELLPNKSELGAKGKNTIQRYFLACRQELVRLLKATQAVPDGVGKSKTLQRFINEWCGDVNELLLDKDPYHMAELAGNVLNAINYQYFWMFARLCEQALMLEKKHNIEPLKLISVSAER